MKKYILKAVRPFYRLKHSLYKLNPFEYSIVPRDRLIDYYLHNYESYDQYKRVQIFHNIRKINRVWADEKTLSRVVDIVCTLFNKNPILGLCHGVRNGFEQNFLNTNEARIKAIGTDISETANNFDNCVEWDFHDVKPEWVSKFDFVYTNSLDQSWRPRDALCTWLNQVCRGGVVIIEHTESHSPSGASEMDPFGVRPIAMPYVLSDWFGHQISISYTVQKKGNMDIDAWLFVVQKLVDEVV